MPHPPTAPQGSPGAHTASVVIPAHDEAQVVLRCLDALLADARPGELEVVVVANGCTDATADVVRASPHDVAVIELPQPGKIGALAAGDAAVSAFPRLFVDADVVVPTRTARAVVAALAADHVMAAGARPQVVGDGVSRLVRWHYEVWSQLPVTRIGYVGSGIYGLSRRGHARAFPLPPVVADDQYVRRCFAAHERVTVEHAFGVRPPRTASAYARRALRGRRGNVELERAGLPLAAESAPRGLRGLSELARRPRWWPRIAAFVVLTAWVRARLALSRGRVQGWQRDESSRVVAGAGAGRD